MKVKLILPALTEARSPYFRPIKYSLFPPLGLATLAAYLRPDDEISIEDEHVERIHIDDRPDLVAIEVYVTSAYRAYEIADRYRALGAHVCLGGLHVTSCPREAMEHADTIFLGPGEDTWPLFLDEFRRGAPRRAYRSRRRSLHGAPQPRRDLIRRERYLVPNSIVVSRGCPHRCEFCYKESFFRGGRSFYTRRVDEALAEIETLPGRHVFFLDDNLFADRRFAGALFDGMRGMGRVWQGASTVKAVLDVDLLDRAVAGGLGSLFIGFETLGEENLRAEGKLHNVKLDYGRAIRELKERGVMVNASFVFGMDGDDTEVFERTAEWAIARGVETSTFHILTPYPGTALHRRMEAEGRILTHDWDLYDTRHAVFRPARMTPAELERGYRRAYREFYGWGAILRSASTEDRFAAWARHVAYTGGWKKLELFWAAVVRLGIIGRMRPLLERVLKPSARSPQARSTPAPEVPRRVQPSPSAG
jgi:radical SAM superfamily enzyme YgiQ (UPF0313 family)